MRTLAGCSTLLLLALAGCAIAPGSRNPGDGCGADVDCASGVCASGTCAPFFSRATGAACVGDIECSGMLCRGGRCTTVCSSQNDCPVAWTCALAHAGDPAPTCFPSTYEMVPGGFGTDCSLVSQNPKIPGTECVPTAANPCAFGFTCHSTVKCDVNAYCTKGCATDADCPPDMFCGVTAAGPCMTDDDCYGDLKCLAVSGGSAKICQAPLTCLKRAYCSDCVVDDQCPANHVCATDPSGGRFCGKLCGSDNDCPQPANVQDNTGAVYPAGDAFEKCLPSKPGSKKNVCRPAVGACHGPSAILKTANDICSWCRGGVPTDCPNGFCYADAFTTEHFCTTSCTVTATAQADGSYAPSGDTCPTGTACLGNIPISCGRSCQVSGVCTAPTMYGYPTCYPMTM